MRLLITGGMGFIGAALVRRLLQHSGHCILNVDKLTYAASPERLADILPHSRHRFVQIDICDHAALQALFAEFDPDAVLHLAAESHVDRSLADPGGFVRSNILGSHALLEASRRHFEGMAASRRTTFRLHMVSTDEVFGTLGNEGSFTEQSPYAPNSPYSASKASADMLARAWHGSYGLPVIISRSSNNYGPWQHPEKLIPTVLAAAMARRSIPVYGDGRNVRQWLHVEDHVSALIAILQRGRPGESYNIGDGTEAANLEIVTALCQAMDQLAPGSTPHAELVRFVSDRPGHDWRYASSGDKLRQELGWQPAVLLAQGLFQTARWYFENRAWWQAMAGTA